MAPTETTIDELLIELYEEDERFRALVQRALKPLRRRKIPPITDSKNAPKFVRAVQDSLGSMLSGESSHLQLYENISSVVGVVFDAATRSSTLLMFALHVISEVEPDYEQLMS